MYTYFKLICVCILTISVTGEWKKNGQNKSTRLKVLSSFRRIFETSVDGNVMEIVLLKTTLPSNM